MSVVHILRVPCVWYRSEPIEKYGSGKYRAWCEKCNQLKPNTTFTAYFMVNHPKNSTGYYYDPHWSYVCKDCSEKMKPLYMDEKEYDRQVEEFLKSEGKR